LEAAFAATRRKAGSGAKALNEAVVGIWHYRYATSSPPAILETHWHVDVRSFAYVWQKPENGSAITSGQSSHHSQWRLLGQFSTILLKMPT